MSASLSIYSSSLDSSGLLLTATIAGAVGALSPSSPTGFVVLINGDVRAATAAVFGSTVLLTLVCIALPDDTVAIHYTPGNLVDASANTMPVQDVVAGNNSTVSWDWYCGTLKDVVKLLFSANLKLLTTPDGSSPSVANPSNPGNLPDSAAAVILDNGFVADGLVFDAVRGGPANVICPLTVGGLALRSSGDTETISTVGYYTAKLVSRLLNEHRMLQSAVGQPDIVVDKLIKAWCSDTDKWLAAVREGQRGLLLDRAKPNYRTIGAVSAVTKPPTLYPGVPLRTAAITIRPPTQHLQPPNIVL